MNSLLELNNYGQTTISYTDDRIAAVKFDRINPINQNTTTAVGQTQSAVIGIDITEIIKPEVVNVYYEIDVSSVAGASVSWATTPSGCTVSNPSSGVYRMSGISTKAQWDIVKNPSIVIGASWDQDFTYYPTIHYEPSKTKAWNVFVLVGVIADLNSSANITAKLTGLSTSAANIQAEATVTVSANHIKSLQAAFVASGGLLALGDISIKFVSTATMNTYANYVSDSYYPGLAAVATLSSSPVKTAVSGSIVSASTSLIHPGTPRLRTSAVPISSAATLDFSPKLQSIARVANGGGNTGNANAALKSNSSYYFIADEDANAVYIYNKSTLALFRTIDNPNPFGASTGDIFGRWIEVNETYLVVAAPGEDTSTVTNAGKVYIFNISTGALVGTCSNPTTQANTFAFFYNCIGLTSSSIFVGAPNEDYSGVTNCGTVYVFNLSGTLTATIRPTSPVTNGYFGSRIYSNDSNVQIGGTAGNTGTYNSSGTFIHSGIGYAMNSTYYIGGSTSTSVSLYNISDGSFVRTVNTIPMSGIYSNVGTGQYDLTDIYILRHNTVYTITSGNFVWRNLNKPSGFNDDWPYYALSNTDVILSDDSGYSWIYKI
jgi:hypothetical protein